MAVGKDTSRKDSLDDEKIDGARIAVSFTDPILFHDRDQKICPFMEPAV